MLQGFCFAAFFSCGHTLYVFPLCFVPVLFSFIIFVVSLHVCLSACSFFVVCLLCAVAVLGVAYFGAFNVFGLRCAVDSFGLRLALRAVLSNVFHRWYIIPHVFLLV
jgi:hypothetical protein